MTTLEKLMMKMAAAGGSIAEYEATGNPLTFETNVAKNLKSLVIPWTPTQSGSGDPSPSNVRSISGITGLNVYHPGNNIVPPDAEYEENYFINSSGEVESGNSYKYTPDYIPVEPNTTYYVSMNKTISTALGFTVPLYDSSKGFIERIVAIGSSGSSGKGTYTGSFTTTNATAFIRISVPKSSDTIEVRKQKNYAVVFPAEAGTVYGGSLDLTTGVLTAEWAGFAKTWADGESATDMGSGITRKVYPMVDNLQTGTAKNMCNIAPYSANENADVHFYYSGSGSTNRKCRLFLPTETDDSTPVVVITNISVPLTYQLTPQQIQTLIGDNVIWSDTNGSNTATYLKKG